MNLDLVTIKSFFMSTGNSAAYAIAIFLFIGFLFVLFAGVITFLVLFLLYNKKAFYYVVFGDVSNPDVLNELTLGVQKKAKARFIKKDGITIMSLLSPRKKTKPIPANLMYPEGVYFLKIGSEFFPIPKPCLNNQGEIVTMLHDIEAWKEWNNFEVEKISKRFPERDAQIRIFLLFIVTIICLTVLVGFIFWLAFTKVGAITKHIDVLSSSLSSISTKLGVNIPN